MREKIPYFRSKTRVFPANHLLTVFPLSILHRLDRVRKAYGTTVIDSFPLAHKAAANLAARNNNLVRVRFKRRVQHRSGIFEHRTAIKNGDNNLHAVARCAAHKATTRFLSITGFYAVSSGVIGQ